MDVFKYVFLCLIIKDIIFDYHFYCSYNKSETLFHMLLNRPAKMRLSISRDYIRSFTWADFAEMQACRYI